MLVCSICTSRPSTTNHFIFFKHKLENITITKANKRVYLAFLNENFLKYFSPGQTKIDPIFLPDYNDVRAFKVFK